MQFPRASGVLLHPTSFPGRYGIGDLGAIAYRFVDFLVEAGQTYWQVLPLGVTGYGDSPYQSVSSYAGNPLLISLDRLIESGWLTHDDLTEMASFSDRRVEYGSVIPFHESMLNLAHTRFTANATPEQKAAFAAWRAAQAGWLENYTLFVALKEAHDKRPWIEWEPELGLGDPAALAKARLQYATEIDGHAFRQWLFFSQWRELKQYANGKGISIIGDLPIFAAHDSVDVWAERHLFYLDEAGNPTVVAGVPPDYFSADGQRWGNPLYRWDVMAQDDYQWWKRRIQASLDLVDLVRIDHFRGFDEYWEVPASEPTARVGKWVVGPRQKFIDSLKAHFGDLPIIAEDLGLMTPTVDALRDDNHLPGMKVLQFAFNDTCEQTIYHPNNTPLNYVVYTGTHDNNTTVGWWWESSESVRNCVGRYVGHHINEPHWDLIRLGMMTVAHTAIFPLQDVWGLGGEARMNFPGTSSGNWHWRFTAEWLDSPARHRLAEMTWLYGRWRK